MVYRLVYMQAFGYQEKYLSLTQQLLFSIFTSRDIYILFISVHIIDIFMIGHQLHYYFVYWHLLNTVIRELCDVKLKLGYNLVLTILILPFPFCIVSLLYFAYLYFSNLLVIFCSFTYVLFVSQQKIKSTGYLFQDKIVSASHVDGS